MSRGAPGACRTSTSAKPSQNRVVGVQAVTDGEFAATGGTSTFSPVFDGVTLSTGDAYGDAKFKGTEEQPPFMLITGKIRRTKPSMLDPLHVSEVGREAHAQVYHAVAGHAACARRPRVAQETIPTSTNLADLAKAYRENRRPVQGRLRYLQIDDTTSP